MSLNLFITQSHFHRYYSSVSNLYTPQSFLSHNPTGYKASWPRFFMDSKTHQNQIKPNIALNKDKLVVIMGATGTGKSRLSIDIATHFPFFEIINSDKMQLYKGLNITTNKIPHQERNGVPHHFLGEFEPSQGELTPSDFRNIASKVVSDINSRRKVPLLVGGSNSFIHALVVEKFDPHRMVFNKQTETGTDIFISSNLRYDCCFIWVDVSFVVLSDYLSIRVDEMIASGMFEELAEYHNVSGVNRTGLEKAIGVPEFDRYFAKFKPGCFRGGEEMKGGKNDQMRRVVFEEAVKAVKEHTCRLAKRQVRKILQLKDAGWDLQRMDATEAFRTMMMTSESDSGKGWKEIWEKQVVESSLKIVNHFLEDQVFS